MLIIGAVGVIRNAIDVFYPNYYYPNKIELQQRYSRDNKDMDAKEIEKAIEEEQERERMNQRNREVRQLAESCALLLVAGPVYLYHWRHVRRIEDMEDHEETEKV